ncbi:hypothetical protein OJ997_00400 [Solirubrobacter phytolaccae]|uniref:Uncharacterized protein n=1 Tax=Solirubrobacter phytolaccae TaxID=1404360 RepID=A0A9X3N2X4_9ACTN|nr:hypothetical protein [Solirubrobacter phytolaccae]MDA0178738.1 hypothetical protein [Solirubrobacter phytolaccae]
MTRRVLAFALAVLTVLVVAPAARADREFTTRFAADQYGDMALIGNGLMTCPAADADCAAAQSGTATTRARDNDFNMTYVDVDGDGSTFDSSTSTLTMPAGATVLFAGLYWSGDTSANATIPSGATSTPTPAAAPNAAFASVALFKTPGASSYASQTADAFDTWNGGTARYSAFKNVTAQVKAAGNGVYTVANVQAGTGADRYAAWSLVVIYKGGSVERNLRVADGLKTVSSTSGTVSFPVNGLKVPSGSPAARLGIVAWEGDATRTGDTATFAGSALSNGLNPAGDVFNSSNTRSGVAFTAKNPNNPNQLGSDIDVFNVSGALATNASTGTLSFTSTGDVYAPAAVVTAIDRAPDAPSNEVAPTVSGTTTDGQTLTVADGTWNGTPDLAYTYQWQRNVSGTWTDIAGATAKTYTLASADAGTTVRAAVKATNDLGNTTTNTAATATIAAVAPVNTVDPALSGTTKVGQTLTTSNGTWSGTTPTFTYQWQRCDAAGSGCADIAGATAQTYTLVAADAGVTVKAKVTATNAAGNAADVTAASSVVTMAPVNTVVPAVTGTPVAGNTLTASTGTWTATPTATYTYQWQRLVGSTWTDISGATAASYVVARADQDAKLRVQVKATNAAGNATAASAQTATATAAPLNTTVPAITGTERDGETLTVGDGAWSGTSPLTYAYQWQRCVSGTCTDISGATAKTYALTAADAGKTLKARVTATNSAGSAPVTTAATGTIAATAPVNTVAPAVTGTKRVGQTLTTSTGTWTGTAPLTYTYAWQRNVDGVWTTIAGATSSTYTLAAADTGNTVRARVTATNTAGNATADTTPTAAIDAAPVNTVAPTATGLVREGATLTATDGTWTGSPAPTFTYAWQRNVSGTWTTIAGATAKTYTLTATDVGKTVRPVVTATNSVGAASANGTATATITVSPPVNAVKPTVSGTAAVGSTLTVASNGTWTGTATITYATQWERCDGATCALVGTGPSYKLVAADGGKTVRARVLASNGVGTASEVGEPTALVASAPVNTVAPVVSGVFTAGRTVTTNNGEWSGTPDPVLAYQWQRCNTAGTTCTDIPGATAQSYTLTASDVGYALKARVTASNGVGSAGVEEAASAPVVAPAKATGPQLVTAPVVTGDPAPGERLTATKGEWQTTGDATYRYQWQRCDAAGVCTDIPGATGDTYDVTDADSGFTVRATVVVTDSAGTGTAVAGTGTAVSDLGSLAGSLVAPTACTTLSSTAIARSSVVPGAGKFKLALKASSKQVSKAAPATLAVVGPTRKLKAIAITVDGKRVRGKVTAAQLVAGRNHTIVAKLTPKTGRTRSVKLVIATAKCAPILTATQKRGARSRTLLLRVDSRWAVGGVSFKLTPALAKAIKRGGGLQITGRTVKHATYKLGKNATLSGAGKPTVKLAGRTAVVTGPPKGTGIVTLTIPVKTTARGRFNATATLSGGKAAALKTSLGAKKRR